MYRKLGEGRLATGEPVQLGVVEAPDEDWVDRVCQFLVHKGGDWNYHIRQALVGPLDELVTHFYVATVEEQVVSHVMISGARGTAILGHVFTAPAWRQRGAYRQLMAAQMADLGRLGLQILTLGTGYDSHPYWIYQSFGFRPVASNSGLMKWLAMPDAEERYLAPSEADVRALRWDDWAALNLLSLRPVAADDALPRLPALGLKGQQSAEGPFLAFMRRFRRMSNAQGRVLQSASGAVAGWALLLPDARWFGDAWLLDVGLLPAFAPYRNALTADLPWPDAPVYSLTTANGSRAEWLQGLGFRHLSTLPRWLVREGQRQDLQMWVRG